MRHRRKALLLALASTGVVVAGALPAGAAEQYSSNVTACGAIIPNAYLYVFDELKNADKGQYDQVQTGSYASTRAYRCYDHAPVKFTGTIDWSITATGFSISCSVAIPAQFGCGGSSTSKTLSYSHDFSGDGYTRTIASTESLYFEDGSFGDTRKVCATVHVVARGKGISTTSCVSA